MTENQLPMEATGGAASRRPGQAPLLSPGRAFSGELDSLLRCAGGVGEAGASYVNK